MEIMPKPLANTAFLPLLLLLPVLALFGSCLALETRPTYIDTGTSTGPSWGVCDESNSCDDCLECSDTSAECGAAYHKCVNSQSCLAYNDCLIDCSVYSGQAQSECIYECDDWDYYDYYGSGGRLYWDYYYCIYCDACPTACGTVYQGTC
jgi:hypothetical protein